MSVVNGYTSLDEIRDQIGDAGSRADGDLISKAINAASRAIDKYCGRRFWQDAEVTTRNYPIDDPTVAWVDDISTTTGLVVKTDPTFDGSFGTTWGASDYQLEPLNVDVAAAADTGDPYAQWRISAVGRYAFPIHARRATLRVTARFGWSAIPDDVNEAAIIKTVRLFRRKDAPFGVAGFGEFGVVRINQGDPDILDMLRPYRRQSLGAV